MMYPPASLGRRVLAFAIDLALVVVIAVVVVVGPLAVATLAGLGSGASVPIAVVSGVLLTVAVVGYALLVARGKGARGTWGMRAVGTAIVDIDDGEPIGFGRAVLRGIVWGASGIVVVGLFSPLLSPQRRGWHDRATAAIVVDARRPLDRASEAAVAESRSEPIERADVTPIDSVPAFEREPQPVAPATADVAVVSPPPVGDGESASPHFEWDSAAPAVAPPPQTPTPVTPVDVGLSEEDMATRVSPGRQPEAVRLVWDDGAVISVRSLTVFGRNPSVGDLEGATASAVADTTRSLSKTHFAITFSDGVPVIVDRHSTNGTTVMHADGTGLSIAPGVPERLRNGDTVVIGERNFTVEVAV